MNAVTAYLTNNPGASVYFLITLMALVWALILAIQGKKTSDSTNSRHIFHAMGILLALQLVALLVNALVWKNPGQDFNILIIFDQAFSILSLVWLFWLLMPAIRQTRLGILAGGTSLLILGLAIFGGMAYFQPPPYNLYIIAWVFYIWHLLAILFCLSGCAWLLVKRPSAWAFSLGILLIALVGHLVDLLNTNEQLLPGLVRLGQMIYLPLLVLYIKKRLPFAPKPVPSPKLETQEPLSIAKESHINLTPTVTASLLEVSLQKSRKKILNSLTHSISLFMMADICCLMIYDKDSQSIQVKNGYDLIREDYLKDFELRQSQSPELFTAFLDGRSLIIKNSRSTDAESIRTLTGYNQLGIVTFFPLKKNGDSVKSGILFFTPYTFRKWDAEEFENLEKVSPTILRVIENSSEVERQRITAEGVLISLNQAKRENDRLQEKHDRCHELLAELRNEFNASRSSHQEEIQHWKSRQESLENEIRKLTEIAERSKTAMNDLNILQGQKLELQKALELSNHRIESLRSTLLKTKTLIEESVSAHITADKADIPLTTNGPITPEAPTEEAPTNVGGTFKAKTRLIDVMERLLNASKVLLDQKGLTLNISYAPEQDIFLPPSIGIEKIMQGLLKNAIKVSPNGREISVEFNLETTEIETRLLIIQVTDQGGGLSQQEQSTFFSMIERHGQPVPGGIGDVMALRDVINIVKSQNGKLWMKSGSEKPTTYKVQLPLINEG